jgi:predicted nuclease of predicted toxin-antitoxin system
MRVLLDECVPAKFAGYLAGHDRMTVPSAGLSGARNGELLSTAEQRGFEVFVTVDQGIAYQQNLSGRSIAILVLRSKTSRLGDLAPLASECLLRMANIRPGELVVIKS